MNDNGGGVIRVWARSALSRRPLDILCCEQELEVFAVTVFYPCDLNLKNTLYNMQLNDVFVALYSDSFK